MTVGGTAAPGTDYIATTGSVSFLAGETSKTVTVTLCDDTFVESNETLFVLLTDFFNCLPAPLTNATITILDNDRTAIGADSFPSGLPAGWSVVTNGNSTACWRFDNPASRTNLTGGGTSFAIADSDWAGFCDMDTELRSPVFNCSTQSAVYLEFKSDFNSVNNEIADVDVSLNGTNGPWVNVWQKTGTSQRGPITQVINISSLAAHTNIMVRFHYYNANYAWWWQVDDIRILRL
jgi:hypothetical protein